MKQFYDNNLLNEIEYQLDTGNPSKALVLSDEYLIDYPADVLGPLYKARALVDLGRADELGDLTDETAFLYAHDTRAAIMGFTQLANIYASCGEQDKAIDLYNKAINLENDTNDFLSLKARSGLVNLYVKNKDFETALDIINDTQNKSDDTFITKKAYIYFLQGKYNDALELLKTTKTEKKSYEEQFSNYLHGRCYFALGKFDLADNYFKKCLVNKNILYYKAIYYLSGVCSATNHLEKALDYANQIENCPELKDNEVRAKFRIYLKMGYTAKAKKLMKKPKEEIFKYYLMTKYYYAIKEYDKAIEYATHVLNEDTTGLFNIAAQIYLMSYMKKGEYEYVKSILPYFYDDIDKLAIHQMNCYIASKQESDEYNNLKMYNCQQILQYDEEKAIQHVIAHHSNNFDSEEYIRELFSNKEELIKGQRCLCDTIFDKYIIPYRGVGFDDEGNCNALVIITLPDSSNVITMYPLSGCEVYFEKNHKTSKEKAREKRPTGLDKFVNKYGFM